MYFKFIYTFILIHLLSMVIISATNVEAVFPKCHPGIMALFKWCEQSDCKTNCTCQTKKVCKQICEQKHCGNLFCESSQTCHQSVLINRYMSKPTVKVMKSISPIVQQDCSQGRCSLMEALRYKNKKTTVFQSCSEGTCGHIRSNGDRVNQFCGTCDRMSCYGEHSTNCTQLCILGKCKEVKCSSKNCKQLCSHASTCNLECDSSSDTCHQECTYGSRCNFNCKAKHCHYHCDASSNCTYGQVNKTDNKTTITPIVNTTKSLINTTLTKTVVLNETTSAITTSRATTKTSKRPKTTATTTLSNEVEESEGNKKNRDITIIAYNNSIVGSQNLISKANQMYINKLLLAILSIFWPLVNKLI